MRLLSLLLGLIVLSACSPLLSGARAQAPSSLGSARTSSPSLTVTPPKLSEAAQRKIGKLIWMNECGGTVDGLTSWNAGEDFPSLGIGHFIWYPEGKRGIFQESFPALIAYADKVARKDTSVPPPPSWTKGACPWTSRTAFLNDKSSPKLKELRAWLMETTALQTQFIIHERCLPGLQSIVNASSSPEATLRKIRALQGTPEGNYALIDYVNFKGEGLNRQERYQGEGWGLAQVLAAMPDSVTVETAPKAFSEAACEVLSRRVRLSPQSDKEARWLPGWHNRCRSYGRPLSTF